jgi:hypothetical protein
MAAVVRLPPPAACLPSGSYHQPWGYATGCVMPTLPAAMLEYLTHPRIHALMGLSTRDLTCGSPPIGSRPGDPCDSHQVGCMRALWSPSWGHISSSKKRKRGEYGEYGLRDERLGQP